MKVLMIPSWYPNEKDPIAGIFTKEFSQDLSKYCEVAVFYPFDDTVSESLTYELEDGLPVYRTSMKKSFIPKTGFIYNTLRFRFLFKRIIKDFMPDIIHAHVACPAGYIAAILGKANKLPVIITEHNTPEFLLGSKTLIRRSSYAIENSKQYICVSKKLQKDIQSYSIKGNYTTIYNSVRVKEDIQGDNCKGNDNAINISFVASMYDKEVKGIQFFLEAIRDIALRNKTPIKAHIVGGGTYLDYFKNMAEELKVLKYCKFYGTLSKEETFRVMVNSDFYVSSSLYETFGCAIVEAMHYGKPVVATKCGGPEEIVTPETGVLVEKGDTHKLTEGIRFMINKYKDFDSLKIKNQAINNFGAERIINQYLKVYRDAMEK